MTPPEILYYVPSDTDTDRMRVNWGGNDDPAGLLVPGVPHVVESKDVRSSHTKIQLQGFPGLWFNSTHFSDEPTEA